MTITLLPVSSRDEPLSDEQLRKLRIMAVGTKKSLTEMMYEAARAELQKEIAAVENAIATEFLKDWTKFDEERDAERDQRNGAEGKGATIRDYPGQVGNASHTTRTVSGGTIPTSVLANMEGKSDEGIGTHRNYQGKDWENFKQDIKENGIKSPIYLNVDHNGKPSIAEGNHRRDAAVELGMKDVPVEISYYGHAERQGTVLERAQAQKMAKEWDPEAHPRGADGRFGDGGGDGAKDETNREPKGNRPDPVNEFLSTIENPSDVHEMGVYHWADARLEQDAALDFEQQRALENYTREEYEPINEGLRGNAAMSQLDALQIEALDSAFTKGNEMSDDTTLYRGIRADASELKEGQVIQDHAFLSTSAAPETAHGFATTDPKGIKSDAPGYVVQITAPSGTPYLVGNAEETEVVMQRNTMLVVDGVESGGKDGVSTVYAHVVGVGE